MLGINPFEVCGEKNSLRMAAPNTRQKWVLFNKNRKFNLLRIRKLDFPIWRGRFPLSPQPINQRSEVCFTPFLIRRTFGDSLLS